jgi:hypothetical protein
MFTYFNMLSNFDTYNSNRERPWAFIRVLVVQYLVLCAVFSVIVCPVLMITSLYRFDCIFLDKCNVYVIIQILCHLLSIVLISIYSTKILCLSVSFDSNTTGITIGTGTAYPFGAPEFTLGFY